MPVNTGPLKKKYATIINGRLVTTDEWDTGLNVNDPKYHWYKDVDDYHHTGLFRNREILERRKRIQERMDKILNRTQNFDHEFDLSIQRKKEWLSKLISIGAVLFIGGFIVISFLSFVFNNAPSEKVAETPAIVEMTDGEDQSQFSDDRYAQPDRY
jgi:hypothetical protein